MNADDYLKSIKPAAQRSALAPFHADVLKLRAAGCTLNQISDFLRMHGVAVTLSTIAKYLRKQIPSRDPATTEPAAATGAQRVPAPAAPARTAVSPDPVSSSPQEAPDTRERAPSREPPGFKSVEQLRAENPTLPAIQITKMYAQQYAGPGIDVAQLEEMKRKYASPQVKP
ncbi:putative membrane protein [Paraburkholderia terricola]|uniref:hypothetical protein n=1 Tax=Paraburkholderia terricola TaxID=169427 RepID=UPI0028562B40|nr:hypothetical protein [Paraburkholderia terricola]MDR6495203.1 putative membrane protein [Paraburkholderia terricola]